VQDTDFDGVTRVGGHGGQTGQGDSSGKCLERKTTMHEKVLQWLKQSASPS
jgi:hypothetical protein